LPFRGTTLRILDADLEIDVINNGRSNRGWHRHPLNVMQYQIAAGNGNLVDSLQDSWLEMNGKICREILVPSVSNTGLGTAFLDPHRVLSSRSCTIEEWVSIEEEDAGERVAWLGRRLEEGPWKMKVAAGRDPD
jgi:hypothetical protein